MSSEQNISHEACINVAMKSQELTVKEKDGRFWVEFSHSAIIVYPFEALAAQAELDSAEHITNADVEAVADLLFRKCASFYGTDSSELAREVLGLHERRNAMNQIECRIGCTHIDSMPCSEIAQLREQVAKLTLEHEVKWPKAWDNLVGERDTALQQVAKLENAQKASQLLIGHLSEENSKLFEENDVLKSQVAKLQAENATLNVFKSTALRVCKKNNELIPGIIAENAKLQATIERVRGVLKSGEFYTRDGKAVSANALRRALSESETQ